MHWLTILLVALLSLQGVEASSRADKTYSKEAIGVTTFSYVDRERERPIKVEFWYPTDDLPSKSATTDDVWIHPREIRGAAFTKEIKKTPLILMSHGHGGDRRERSWLAEILVRSGFAVAAVDHYGNTWDTMSIVESVKFWERPKDISFAIDKLLAEPTLRRRIDAERIGFVGYSLGGMTGLSLAGAVAENIEQGIEENKEQFAQLTPEILSQIDFTPGRKAYRDSRIKAVLLLAPATWFYAHTQSIRSLTTPIGLVATLTDDVLAFDKHFQPLIVHSVPSRVKLLRNGATHFTFLNRVTEKGKRILKAHVYREPPGLDRNEVHRDVGVFAIEFFRQFLKKP